VSLRHFETSGAKICRPVYLVGEFLKEEGIDKKWYISSIRSETPHGRICTKFGIG